jgi:hypothetical protein
MAVKPKIGSGSSARKVRKVRDGSPRSLRRGRPPKATCTDLHPNDRKQAKEGPDVGTFQTEYEAARIKEVRLRAELFRLRARQLSGELLERKLVVAEVTAVFMSIKEGILASSMSEGEKQNLLNTLASIPVEYEPVANAGI